MAVIGNETTFEATHGLHYTKFENDLINLQMADIENIEIYDTHTFLNTGSPHHVKFCNAIATLNVAKLGSKIRYGAPYFEEGTNVNFVEQN